MNANHITSIYGREPHRGRKYPFDAIVGDKGITRIERREESLGEYGIIWFDVFKGDRLIKSINSLQISEIYYSNEAQTS
jgi:hypothetical protein